MASGLLPALQQSTTNITRMNTLLPKHCKRVRRLGYALYLEHTKPVLDLGSGARYIATSAADAVATANSIHKQKTS